MAKTLLYTLAMLFDFVFAGLAYQSGRTGISLILLFAGLCFAVAAICAAFGRGRPPRT